MLSPKLEARLGELRTSVSSLLQYVTRSTADYTNHGIAHSEEVERLLREVVELCNNRERKCNISPLEGYLLLSSAWLHDIGNVRGREKHNESTCLLLDKLVGKYIWGIEADTVELLRWICYAHPRKIRLGKVPKSVQLRGSIKLRFLSALFRLIDASDMASRRAPFAVFLGIEDQLDDESKEYWKSHPAIMDVSFREETREIVVTVTDKKTAKKALDEFKKEFRSVRSILLDHEFPCTKLKVSQIPKVPLEETAE
jgi:hypothetical protein